MPPIRTAKKNDSAAKEAPLTAFGFRKLEPTEANHGTKPAGLPKPKKQLIQPASTNKGSKLAVFQSSKYDWDGRYDQVIGTSTRTIKFGSATVLTDAHIEQILAKGSQVCNGLTEFIFVYGDVSYNAHNGATEVTSNALIRLAKACPNLKKVQLQDTSRPTDDVLLAFVRGCPKLTCLEITGRTEGGFSDEALDRIRENPDWAPKLKNLILASSKNKKFIKTIRELTRARETLTVQLRSMDQVKVWGDWELETTTEKYKRGRKQSDYGTDWGYKLGAPPG